MSAILSRLSWLPSWPSRLAAARRLYAAIVAAARHPVPYASWGVPDSLDGRFDMISLHMFLALERLKGEAEAFSQNLVNEFFADMDRSLREIGVGDVSVGKKVRKMAEVFYGRVGAYEINLAAGLARNMPCEAPEKLLDYVLSARVELGGQTNLTHGEIVFPEPCP